MQSPAMGLLLSTQACIGQFIQPVRHHSFESGGHDTLIGLASGYKTVNDDVVVMQLLYFLRIHLESGVLNNDRRPNVSINCLLIATSLC